MHRLGEEDRARQSARVVVVGLELGASERCEEELSGAHVVGASSGAQR